MERMWMLATNSRQREANDGRDCGKRPGNGRLPGGRAQRHASRGLLEAPDRQRRAVHSPLRWLGTITLLVPALWVISGCPPTADDDATSVTSTPETPPDEPLPADISVYPAAVDFGDVPVGAASPAYLVVQNLGESSLEFQVTIAGTAGSAFFLSDDVLVPPSIDAGAATTVAVVFRPADTGTVTDTLQITSNDPDEPQVDVPLSGNGTASAETDRDGDSYTVSGGDCDDGDPSVYPGAVETCDQRDNDCDGEFDEDGQATFYLDSDQDGHGDPDQVLVTCSAPFPYVSVAGDCNDADSSVYEGAPELCDAKDNDCDASVDEDVQSVFYADADGDGYGDAENPVQTCLPEKGQVANPDDCDDTDPLTYPGAVEICDGKDNDCDSDTSEADPDVSGTSTWYADADGDGYGNGIATSTACVQPDGYVPQPGDCDDTDPGVNPDTIWYIDYDQDGHGTPVVTLVQCEQPEGFARLGDDCDDTDPAFHPGAQEDDCDDPNDYNCDGSVAFEDADADGYAACDDCDDTDPDINPGAPEICDEDEPADNDCDGLTDDADDSLQGGTPFYQDLDGDGYGDPASSTLACVQPQGFVTNATDCDDTSSDINPETTWYLDVDGDGYGDDSRSTHSCSQPTEDYVRQAADCDDLDPSYHPGQEEQCDGNDYNCDGRVDNDADGDGYPDIACGGTDCNDADDTIMPEPGGGCALGQSCADALARGLDFGNGVYTIDPDGYDTGVAPFDVYCDMNTEGGGWTLLFNLASRDTALHDYDDANFWLTGDTEGSPDTALATGFKSQAYASLDDFDELMILLHDRGTPTAHATYQVLEPFLGRTLLYLFNNVSNAPITTPRVSGEGTAGTTQNPNRSQREYGDLFADHEDAVVLNRSAGWSAQTNYNRFATTLTNNDYPHTFGGLGGFHVNSGWGLYYESAPITPYCSTTNGYGEEDTYTVGNYKPISGYSFPYQSTCRGTVEGTVFIWLPIDTAVWVR